jgi:hypothetical protein
MKNYQYNVKLLNLKFISKAFDDQTLIEAQKNSYDISAKLFFLEMILKRNLKIQFFKADLMNLLFLSFYRISYTVNGILNFLLQVELTPDFITK